MPNGDSILQKYPDGPSGIRQGDHLPNTFQHPVITVVFLNQCIKFIQVLHLQFSDNNNNITLCHPNFYLRSISTSYDLILLFGTKNGSASRVPVTPHLTPRSLERPHGTYVGTKLRSHYVWVILGIC